MALQNFKESQHGEWKACLLGDWNLNFNNEYSYIQELNQTTLVYKSVWTPSCFRGGGVTLTFHGCFPPNASVFVSTYCQLPGKEIIKQKSILK